MKKGILKLLLASVFITSFSVHAVDIAQVLDATDNLSIEDQAEIIFKTAILKTLNVNTALGVSSDKLELAIPIAIALPFLPIIGGVYADNFINKHLISNSISHRNERRRVSSYEEQLRELKHDLDNSSSARKLMVKRDKVLSIINDRRHELRSLPENASIREKLTLNSIREWKSDLEEIENQIEKISSDQIEIDKKREVQIMTKRAEIQKQLDAAKHELRLMQTKKGFFYKIGRSAYKLKGAIVFTTIYAGVMIAITDSVLIISYSEKKMNHIQEQFEQDIELLIEKSNALFPEDYDI